MAQPEALRPRERRMMRMAESGMDELEIAWRFRRSPRYVRQVLQLSRRPNRNAGAEQSRHPMALRPIERRVLHWRDQGAGLNELAPRFRRTPRFLGQVENLARYKLANS